MHWANALRAILVAVFTASPCLAMDDEAGTPTVDVSVVDSEGKPAPNAIVRLLGGASAESSGRTDAAGTVRVPRPIAAELSSIPVIASDAEGANQAYVEWHFRDPEEARKPVRVELSPGAELSVQVTDSREAPVADALVAILTSTAVVLVQERTGPNGSVRLRYPTKSDPFSVIALKPGVGFDNWTTMLFVEGQPEEVHKVPPQLALKLERSSTVRIRAIDRLGNPLPGVAFSPRIMTRQGGHRQSFENIPFADAITDEEGEATFDWLPINAHCGFQARSNAYFQTRKSGLAVNLSEDRPPVRPLNAYLSRRGTISGTIRNPDGTPAPGIVVVGEGIDDNGDSNPEAGRSGADGAYRIPAAPGHIYLLGIDDGEWAAETRQGIRIDEGETVGDVDFQLIRGTLVRGINPEWKHTIVIRQIGEGIPRLRPGGAPLFPTLRRVALPNDGGEFAFHVGPGHYRVDWGRSSAMLTVTDEAEIVPDIPREPRPAVAPRRAAGGNVVKLPGRGLLTGTVHGPDGEPVPKATIRGFYRDRGRGLKEPWFVNADVKGRFQNEWSLTTHWLFASSADGTLAGSARVEPENNPVELKLSPAARIVGRLFDGDVPLSEIDVTLTQQVPIERGVQICTVATARTDDNGRFSLTGVVIGETYAFELVDNPGTRSERRGPGKLTIKHPGLVDLGYIDAPPQRESMNDGLTWNHPNVVARFIDRFRATGDLASRIATARADAASEERRVMLVVGLPGTEATRSTFEVLEGLEQAEDFPTFYRKFEARHKGNPEPDDDLKRPLANFHRVYVNARNKADAAHLAGAYRIDVSRTPPPIIALLNGDGKLTTFRWFGHADDPSKVDKESLREFIKLHALKPRDAEGLLGDALRRAKAEEKYVLLVQSGADSHPSRLLGRFLDRHRQMFDRDYVVLSLDTYRASAGDAVIKQYRASGESLPWMAILDPDGKKLVDADSPYGNIGFPSEPETIEFFIDEMLKPTAKRLTAADLETLRKSLSANVATERSR